ncbi:DUF1669 domain-containing protein [Candidatus Micrarchaeota archaeon]|nr:DUF1669 domain-containing protein [Candidatus Micrarchaeota archaeon]MBU1930270.1 DUF1669 domain-containing protein [Candidatus Micrarchaeota archaeon]
MKLKWLVLLILLVFGLGYWIGFDFQNPETGLLIFSDFSETVDSSETSVFFCPIDSCDQQLIERIMNAEQSIDIAIYSFTLEPVADALILAHQNGIVVRVLIDAGQANSQYAVDEKLEETGIFLKRVDLVRGIMHNKYIIIDEKLVGTGSFNYSKNGAQYNKENLVFISNPAIARQFEMDFESLWDAS